MIINQDIRELLETEATAINRPDFIDDDPVKFVHRFSDKRDIEITALLVSAIAWGNRKMILKDADKMLGLMSNQPYRYLMEDGFEELPFHENIHRTFFTENLAHFLRGLKDIYKNHPTLDDFAIKIGVPESEFPAWSLANAINHTLKQANKNETDSRCLPLNIETTALKRLNMALRWLVRDDGIVDLGLWHSIKPSQLFIPLDVHVANISRDLGLLSRRSNDRKAVIELTETLRTIRPLDPVYFDYALFGIGVTGRRKILSDFAN